MTRSTWSVLLVLGAVAAVTANGSLTSSLSAADLQAAAASAKATLSDPEQLTAGTSLAASSLLSSLQGMAVEGAAAGDLSQYCSGLSSMTTSSTAGIASTYLVRNSLGCSISASEEHKLSIKAGLSAKDTMTMSFCALAAPVVGVDVDTAGLVKAMASRFKPDGTARDRAGGRSSALQAGRIVESLAAVVDSAAMQDAATAQAVRDVLRRASSLAAALAAPSNALAPSAPSDKPVEAVAHLIRGLTTLAAAAGEPNPIAPATLAALSSVLVQAGAASPDLATAAAVARGVAFVAALPAGGPIAVRLQQRRLAAGQQLAVEVTDILGRPLDEATVTVAEARSAGLGAAGVTGGVVEAASEMVLAKSAAGTFAADLLALPGVAAPSRVALTLTVAPQGDRFAQVEGIALEAELVRSVELGAMTVTVEAEGASPAVQELSAGARLSAPLVAKAGNVVRFSTSASGRVQQAFLRLTPVDGASAPALYVLTPAAQGDSVSFSTAVDTASRASLGNAAVGGVFEVEVLLADAGMDAPRVWAVGQLSVVAPPVPSKPDEILYTRPLLDESDRALSPLPEIEHQFRQPEARPPMIVPLVVCGLIGVGFFVTATSMFAVTSGAGLQAGSTVANLGFMLCICAVFALIGYFFVYLQNIIVLVTYLGLLAVPTVFFGQWSLSAIAAANDDDKEKQD